MRRLLLLALLAPIFAHAAVIATARNTQGGTIFVTDTKDDCPGKAHSYSSMSFADEKIDDYGCWVVAAKNAIMWRSSVTGNTGYWFYDASQWTFYAGAFSK